MLRPLFFASLASLLLSSAQAQTALFNGKDLTGWTGNPELWSVKDGAIQGQTTAEKPLTHNTFLVWSGKVADFELTVKYRFGDGGPGPWKGNSGIQYRSEALPPGECGPIITGYQADMDPGNGHTGMVYEERGRGLITAPGQKVVLKQDPANPAKHLAEVVGSVAEPKEIKAAITNDWNEYKIVAKGNHLQQFINGKPTVDLVDEQASKARKEGLLALQIHRGAPMIVQFKDIVLTELK